MTPKQKDVLVLVLLIIALVTINYGWLDNALNNFLNTYEQIHVDRIIDGDTIESNSTSIRLLGINARERGELYYEEAKEFLENEILNKTVGLEYGKEHYDKYHRVLAYVFLDNRNINLKIIENGYANIYFPSGKDRYYNQFKQAWEDCIDKNINLCEKSVDKCADCIELKEFGIKEQKVVLFNNCGFSCDLTAWELKGEGRKKFVFGNYILDGNNNVEIIVGEGVNSRNQLYWPGEDYVWTASGDTIFLRDKEGKLVVWESC